MHSAESVDVDSGTSQPENSDLYQFGKEYFEHRWCDEDTDWCYTIAFTCADKNGQQCSSEWDQIEAHFLECILNPDTDQDQCIKDTTEWSKTLGKDTPAVLAKSKCSCESFVQITS